MFIKNLKNSFFGSFSVCLIILGFFRVLGFALLFQGFFLRFLNDFRVVLSVFGEIFFLRLSVVIVLSLFVCLFVVMIFCFFGSLQRSRFFFCLFVCLFRVLGSFSFIFSKKIMFFFIVCLFVCFQGFCCLFKASSLFSFLFFSFFFFFFFRVFRVFKVQSLKTQKLNLLLLDYS